MAFIGNRLFDFKITRMKCDSCIFKKFHSGGSWYAVAEGGDDPYNYEYCQKGRWAGDDIDQREPEDSLNDPFEFCKDYKNISAENSSHYGEKPQSISAEGGRSKQSLLPPRMKPKQI